MVAHDDDLPEALRAAVRDEMRWFNGNLPVPSGQHFAVRSRKRWYCEGICWFRADAREMVRRANVLAALISELGLEIVRLHTDCPGQILYRDDWQIVAKPDRRTPVAWH
jgi:hypothetical protein